MELLNFDKEYKKKILVGVDEAGRGPLSGPVVAAAVYLGENIPKEYELINDSKKISEKKRDILYKVIKEEAYVGVGIVDEKKIDEINILNATFLAMKIAVENLMEEVKKDLEVDGEDIYVLVDGNKEIKGTTYNQEAVVKGDGKSLSIAAASIIAKVTRDEILVDQGKEYPEYDFGKHKGYGTKKHVEVLKEIGPCKYHRKTFLKKILGEN